MGKLPLDVVQLIVNQSSLDRDENRMCRLRRLALVCRGWTRIAQAHLFRAVSVEASYGLSFTRLIYVALRPWLAIHVRDIELTETGTFANDALWWLPHVFKNVTHLSLSGMNDDFMDIDDEVRLPVFVPLMHRVRELTVTFPASPEFVWVDDPAWDSVRLRKLEVSASCLCGLLRPLMEALSRGATRQSLKFFRVIPTDLDILVTLDQSLRPFTSLVVFDIIASPLQAALETMQWNEHIYGRLESVIKLPSLDSLRVVTIFVSTSYEKCSVNLIRLLFAQVQLPALRELNFILGPMKPGIQPVFDPLRHDVMYPERPILPTSILKRLTGCLFAFHDVGEVRQSDAFFGLFGLASRPEIRHVSHPSTRLLR